MKVVKTGLTAGSIMALFLAALSITGNYGGSPLKYIKYLVLIGFLIVFYKRLFKRSKGAALYSKYILGGAAISVIAGSIVGITNGALFLMNSQYSIQKFNLLATSAPEALLISFVLLVEISVLGIICSFIVFPFYKNRIYLK